MQDRTPRAPRSHRMFRSLSFALLLLPSCAFAATETVPMDVSLTVRESCRIESGERASTTPEVSCALDSPYRIQAGTAGPPRMPHAAPKATRQPAPALWEVVF